MIELVYSNMTEHLLGALVSDLRLRRQRGAHPLEPVEVIVPNRNMETWVRLAIAEAMGVAANIRFRRLEQFVGELVMDLGSKDVQIVDTDKVRAAILSVLLDEDAQADPELQPVFRYLQQQAGLAGGDSGGHKSDSDSKEITGSKSKGPWDEYILADGIDIRRVQLASRMAHLFQEYSYSRPEMIAAWRMSANGNQTADHRCAPYSNPARFDSFLEPTLSWQRALWRRVFSEDGVLKQNPPREGGGWTTLDAFILENELFQMFAHKALPPFHVFGVSYVARLFQLLFSRLGEATTLRIYTLNPCAEFWEDVETDRELFRRLSRESNRRSKKIWIDSGEDDNEDPFDLSSVDNRALSYWGRPGREHIRLLGELTDCDFHSAFADPSPASNLLLHRLQRDILFREPETRVDGEGGSQSDDSIKLIAAPNARREVEWVADEIWRLLREDSPAPGCAPLRFNDIAVIVNSADRDLYLPHLEAVFSVSHGLEFSLSDVPGTASSPLVEAFGLILNLPFGRFSRAEMLSLMTHQALAGRLESVLPADMTRMAEALGIVFGADRKHHRGTYIDEDVYNWDQGIRRLALGAFMTGERSGDERIFETNKGRWLVEEISGSSLAAGAEFGFLARSLLADAAFVREEKLTLSQWSEFYSYQIDKYLDASDRQAGQDRLRCFRALSKLVAMDLGKPVSGRVAAQLAGEAIESLSGGKGRYLGEGVVISSFLPMRAIPFKAVFVLGLGEGRFPAAARRDALDLRSARRRAGDVDPSERDRYMFLETLMCARRRLYLSYVRRDEQTGDPLQPSAVVQELLDILKVGYVGQEGLDHLRVEPSLRRYEDTTINGESFIDEARVEAKVLDISRDWVKHNCRFDADGSQISSPCLFNLLDNARQIRQHVSESSWQRLSHVLGLPGDPPALTASCQEEDLSGCSKEESRVEAPVFLSANAIRRFLECPMQGWASHVLGLQDEEEDTADREEEDFELSMLDTTLLLRNTFLYAAARSLDAFELYEKRAQRLQLSGKMPLGKLGTTISRAHKEVFSGWISSLEDLVGTGELESFDGQLPRLHSIRIGSSGVSSPAERVLDPIILEIPVVSPRGSKRVVPVRVSGFIDGLLDDLSVSFIFQPRKPTGRLGEREIAKLLRYMLKGLIDHLLLSAAGLGSDEERRIFVMLSSTEEESTYKTLMFKPLSSGQAISMLSNIVSDLLNDTHAYLMPAEAVFVQFYNDLSPDSRAKQDKTGFALNAARIIEIIKAMASDENLSFSSIWGAVPDARSYPPPGEDELAAYLERRFAPILESITKVGLS